MSYHNDPYRVDYLKIYPCLKERPDVLEVLKKSDRKMKYMEVDLKSEQRRKNAENGAESYVPSKEDSLERLVYSAKCQFADDAEGVEDAVIKKDDLCRLRAALDQLSEEERVLIHQVINRLYSMIRDGKYCGSCSGFTMSFNLTEELRQSIRTIGETACSFSCSLGMHVELFDQKLDFNIIRKIDSMRLDNFEKITKKIDALDNGDPIKVSFVSGNTDPNIHYSDMFYSEETAKNLLKETVS